MNFPSQCFTWWLIVRDISKEKVSPNKTSLVLFAWAYLEAEIQEQDTNEETPQDSIYGLGICDSMLE
jgi:hypothetical protein